MGVLGNNQFTRKMFSHPTPISKSNLVACRSITGEVESKVENAAWCTQLKQKIQEFHVEAKKDLKRDQADCSFEAGKPHPKRKDDKKKKKKKEVESESDSKETGGLNNPENMNNICVIQN